MIAGHDAAALVDAEILHDTFEGRFQGEGFLWFAVLFEIRHLVVGSAAQEIEGDDQDGKRFKLSDYRGKIVLLYFWSEY